MEKDNLQSRIYTKSGDKGLTSLIGGKKIAKSSLRVESYGTIDELNTYVGLLMEEVADEEEIAALLNIQSLLFVIGYQLATESRQESLHQLRESDIDRLEKEIDRIDATLPKLSGFVMPGGSRNAATCHICRAICRRAERRICALNEIESVENHILIYVNRLSDYLFVLARKLCLAAKKNEIFWHNTCK